MKRFDIAVDISKQLIAISTAMLVGIAALTTDILNNEQNTSVFTCLLLLYFFLGLSVVAGIVHLGAIANLVETSEKRTHNLKNGDFSNEFVSVFDNSFAPKSCLIQQLLFCAAIVFLLITLVVDRSVNEPTIHLETVDSWIYRFVHNSSTNAPAIHSQSP